MTSILSNFINLPEPDEPARGEELCRLCALDGGSCCRTEPELTYLSFPLSLPEWRRIAPYARLATTAVPADAEAFAREEAETNPDPLAPETTDAPPPGGDAVCDVEENRPDFITSMHSLFRGWKKRVDALFPPNGRHLTLRTRADGSCAFLGSYGCRLPRDVRPWYCLLFPAWIAGDSLTLFSSADCLIARKARGPAHGLALLRSTAEAVRTCHARLRKDWGLE